MSYLTGEQAVVILAEMGLNSDTWTNLDANQKQMLVARASKRIESVPFQGDWPSPRFKDGFVANEKGQPIKNQPMPMVLQDATAQLAYWYAGNPDPFSTLIGEGLEDEEPVNPYLTDMPLPIQNALMQFIYDDAKDAETLGASKELIDYRREAEVNKTQASPIKYE